MEEINISPNVIPILFGFILFNNVIGVNYFICGILLLNGIQLINNKFKFADKIKNFIDDLELNENHGNFLWELLHLYSRASITFNQYILLPTNKYIVTPFSNIIEGSVLDVDRIIFVSDGNPVLKFKSKASMINYLRKERKRDVTTEYDFILFYPKNQNTMILDNINDIPDINHVDKKHINSNVGFMACQLIIHRADGDIKKHLSLDEYMINGNEILSREFVLWYCKTFFKDEFLNINELKNYTIHLLDNNVNEFKLTQNDSIKIHVDGFTVITYEDDDEDHEHHEDHENGGEDQNNGLEKVNEGNEEADSSAVPVRAATTLPRRMNETDEEGKENEKKEKNNEQEERENENMSYEDKKDETESTLNKNSDDEKEELVEIIDDSVRIETNVQSSAFWEIAKFNFKYFNGAISLNSNNEQEKINTEQ
jgi:hypothetical protein